MDYQLHGSAEAAQGAVRINDVPVHRWFSHRDLQPLASQSISQWIAAGDNELMVMLRPDTADREPSCRLVVDVSDAGRTERLLQWPASEQPPRRISRVRFRTPTAPAQALWRDAEALPDTPVVRDEALAFAAEVHALMGARDVLGVVHRQRYALRDAAIFAGRGATPKEWTRAVSSQYTYLLDPNTSDLFLSPFDRSRTTVERVGHGQLLWVSRDDTPWAFPLHTDRLAKEPAVTGITMVLAQIGGQLRWVR